MKIKILCVKNLLLIIIISCIVVFTYNRGYYKGYCRGYNEALDTCVSILHKPVKDSSVVSKVLIEDSTITHVFYLRKKKVSYK